MSSGAPNVALGSVVVVLSCLGAGFAADTALRRRSLAAFICMAGALLIAAGSVGARAFPDQAAAARQGADAAARIVPGFWDAGVSIPGVGVEATPVAVAGMLLAVAGISLVLLLEPAEAEHRDGSAGCRHDDDDAI